MKPFLMLLLLSLLAACHPPSTTGDHPLRGEGIPREITFRGEVVFIGLEGGFYGLVDETQNRYDPVNLPPDFALDGLPVEVHGRLLPGTAGFHMWGTPVEIISIDKR